MENLNNDLGNFIRFNEELDDKLEKLYEEQNESYDQLKFYLDSFENESWLKKDVTKEFTTGDFLKGEVVIDTGDALYIENITYFEQYFTNGKILQTIFEDGRLVDKRLLLHDNFSNSPKGKLTLARQQLDEMLKIQDEIDQLEEGEDS